MAIPGATYDDLRNIYANFNEMYKRDYSVNDITSAFRKHYLQRMPYPHYFTTAVNVVGAQPHKTWPYVCTRITPLL